MKRFHFLLALGAMALPACGGLAVVERDDAAGGASAGATTSTTTQTSTTVASSSASGPAPCGTFGGASCSPDEFCDWPDDSCGAADGGGVCEPKPEGCTADCPGVCGCDNQFYCNACSAHALGVDVSTSKTCLTTSDSSISAYHWSGGLDHLVLRKRDEANNWCVLVHAAWPMSNTSGFDVKAPPEWGVSGASISDSAADCDDPLGPVSGSAVSADGAVGIVDWTVPAGLFAPCELSLVDLIVTFPGGTPWAPTSVSLSANDVLVENGCM